MHESFDHDVVRAASDRSFGLVFAAVFAVIALWPLAKGSGPRWWSLALAIGFLAAALAFPRLLRPLNQLWFRLAEPLQRVMTTVFMGLIFIFGILPTALFARLFRRDDPLRIRRRRSGGTNWITRTPPGPAPDSMKHLF